MINQFQPILSRPTMLNQRLSMGISRCYIRTPLRAVQHHPISPITLTYTQWIQNQKCYEMKAIVFCETSMSQRCYSAEKTRLCRGNHQRRFRRILKPSYCLFREEIVFPRMISSVWRRFYPCLWLRIPLYLPIYPLFIHHMQRLGHAQQRTTINLPDNLQPAHSGSQLFQVVGLL